MRARPLLLIILASLPFIRVQAAPRIVDCAAPVPSSKRGVCANELAAKDFAALHPSVTWYYTWFHQPTFTNGTSMQFLPMVWGTEADRLSGARSFLKSGARPRALFALNEPNLKGQAFVTPEEAARSYAAIASLGQEFGVPVIGPHMAIGSATDASITAFDPIEKKTNTYTYMVPYLKAFLYYADTLHAKVEAIGVHSYGDINELKWVVDMTAKEFGRPVWVTEFAQWNARDVEAARDYLIEAVDFLESSTNVAGYAWFKERADNPKISLLDAEPGKLSTLGRAYVAMPVHDADLFYRIPGTLSATRYATASNTRVRSSLEHEGEMELATQAGAVATYHLFVPEAGVYTMTFRVTSSRTGYIEVAADEAIARAGAGSDGDQDMTATITLAQGLQALRVKMAATSVRAIAFAKTEGSVVKF